MASASWRASSSSAVRRRVNEAQGEDPHSPASLSLTPLTHSLIHPLPPPPPPQPAGQGSKLIDSKGKEYVDFFGGIAVNALGHSDPQVAEVIARQATKIQHTSNILHTWEPLELAKHLVTNSKHFTKVFLCNSGTEANEAALKFARKMALFKAMQKAQGIEVGSATKPAPHTAFGCKAAEPRQCFTQGGMCGCWPQANNATVANGVKNEVIAFKNSFHGRTMGALSVTHKPAIRMPFAPFPADARFARFNNLDGASVCCEGRA
jgi:acetylornithine aminotransferase